MAEGAFTSTFAGIYIHFTEASYLIANQAIYQNLGKQGYIIVCGEYVTRGENSALAQRIAELG